ncbi:hypothetical protein POSPLADRAFT_1064664 [Postia placenta MAD-698-R-SB12]|uniref:Xylanolytic transcriptional activator regulatory domain-containing protein n=1 Tax=Postia placenta MAD-698-R-SB12 TaxID=670580 RepID=A0A1X6NCU5_9APHY|nr:hypothetical protein POSPLADRAFT_1064664 [Postia placenta MAD-698-R-SB12]OSX66266.1 hypothetical protein POSPLADRAFT_1064664 [Postia placenta MAD-698-R-SB12]
MNFIDSVLARARDELVVELAKESVNWEHQINLALAVCLFQTLGLFHRNPEQRAFSNVYHGMLAMMFRLNGFSRATFDWVPPTDIDHASAPRLWREWAQHETAKRALAVSYLHDCCHCIYFNLRPTYDTTDFDMRLPCEDALWTASTADEWLQLLRQPSRYGSIQERLRGPMLRATYDKLAEPESVSATPLVLNPWSHNILIHVALRQFFEEFLEARLPEIGTPRASSPSRRDTQYISDERIAELQLIMHNWLQSWLHSPESPTYNAREPRFMNQALPYYWFSQVAILAYQERLPPFCTSTTFVVSGEAKFRLMKKWERHIRKFLRRGGTEPTVFLDDLIKTRMRKWDSSGLVEDAEEDPVHLLGFFPGT